MERDTLYNVKVCSDKYVPPQRRERERERDSKHRRTDSDDSLLMSHLRDTETFDVVEEEEEEEVYRFLPTMSKVFPHSDKKGQWSEVFSIECCGLQCTV